MTDDELRARIVADPTIMVGQPCVRGTRIPARLVLELLAHGATYDEIFEDYPSLTSDDIAACLLHASDALEREAATTLAATG
jgi:uncharacterized protein (DUF433 family)